MTDRLNRTLGWLLAVLMGVSVLNVLWQVFTRFVLSNPSSYTEELARYLLMWVGLIGGAYATGQGSHLAIDLLPQQLTGPARRRLLIFIQSMIATFAISVLVIGGFTLVSLTLTLGQTSAALGIPIGYVYLALPLSGGLMAWYTARNIRELLTDR